MAAIALQLPFALRNWLPAVVTAASLTFPRASWSLQSLLDLFPPILLAVPKSKTSHSRKAMRSANKGLKDKRNISNCAACGAVKLSHHICPNCYSAVTREWKGTKGRANDIPDFS